MLEEKRKTKGTADLVDKYVGKQLKSRRSLLGLSQEKLADSVGVTFQQVQKYERGTNRISASRLFSFSKILDVSIDFFYEGLPTDEDKSIASHQNTSEDDCNTLVTVVKGKKIPENIFSEKESIDLIRSYYSVTDQVKRKEILKVVKTMAKSLK